MDTSEDLLSAAVDIARTASGLAARRFLEGVPAGTKADGSEVTPADVEVLLLPAVKGLLDLASGRIDALIIAGMPMDYEDLAPIPLLIGEAGGRVSDLDGHDVLSGNGTVLASNGHIHDALLDLVRDMPSGRDYRSLIQARR